MLEEGSAPAAELAEPCLPAHVKGRIRPDSLDTGVVSVVRIRSLLLVKKRCWMLVTCAEKLRPLSSRETPGFAASRKIGRTEFMKKKLAEQLNGRKIAACFVCLLALFDEKFATSRVRLELVVENQSPNLGLESIKSVVYLFVGVEALSPKDFMNLARLTHKAGGFLAGLQRRHM